MLRPCGGSKWHWEQSNSVLFSIVCLSLALAGPVQSACPQRVELIEGSRRSAVLTASDWRVQTHQPSYRGRATHAVIYGPAGTVVTFFDDQRYRVGENFLSVVLKVNGPITVPLAWNFVPRQAQQGPGEYCGSTAQYDWVLYKQVAWWNQIKHGVQNAGRRFVGQYAPGSEQVIPRGKSTNYRIDNCSSVKFCE